MAAKIKPKTSESNLYLFHGEISKRYLPFSKTLMILEEEECIRGGRREINAQSEPET